MQPSPCAETESPRLPKVRRSMFYPLGITVARRGAQRPRVSAAQGSRPPSSLYGALSRTVPARKPARPGRHRPHAAPARRRLAAKPKEFWPRSAQTPVCLGTERVLRPQWPSWACEIRDFRSRSATLACAGAASRRSSPDRAQAGRPLGSPSPSCRCLVRHRRSPTAILAATGPLRRSGSSENACAMAPPRPR